MAKPQADNESASQNVNTPGALSGEQHYRSLISKMMNGFALHEIICDDDGRPCDYRYLEINEAFEKMTGLVSDRVVGKTVRDVLPNIESHWIETFGKVALNGESIHYENYVQELGKHFDVLAYCPEKGYFAVVFTDITQRKEAEEKLEIMQSIVDHASDATFWMGEDARLLYVNESVCNALGYTRDELLAMTVHDLDPDFPEPVWKDTVNQMKDGRTFLFESRHQAKDGRLFPVEIAANYVEFNNKGYVCAFARDITERKQVEDGRKQLIAELQKAIHEIKTLRGILPLCSFCKKIRDDKGYWEKVDVYLHKHSLADFSHSICPDCVKEHYPDFNDFEKD